MPLTSTVSCVARLLRDADIVVWAVVLATRTPREALVVHAGSHRTPSSCTGGDKLLFIIKLMGFINKKKYKNRNVILLHRGLIKRDYYALISFDLKREIGVDVLVLIWLLEKVLRNKFKTWVQFRKGSPQCGHKCILSSEASLHLLPEHNAMVCVALPA